VSVRRRRVVAAVVAVVVLALAATAIVAASRAARTWLWTGCTATSGTQTADLDLEQARYASIVAAGSVQHRMPPRAATIALATAFQESDIRNLDHGHADSVGLFQQRPSMGWGSVAQIMDPYYSTDRFYTALAKIDGYTAMSITDAAQKVQKSAYGNAYAKHGQRSRILASALTGQTPAAFTCTIAKPGTDWSVAQTARNAKLAFGNRVDASATGGRDGAGAVVVTVPTAQGGAAVRERIRWAVAAWAVANAAQAPIEGVAAGGKVWRSSASDKGWTTGTGQAASNRVTITLSATPMG